MVNIISIRNNLKKIYYLIGIIFTIPLIIPFIFAKNKQIIILDVRRWAEIDMIQFNSDIINILYFLFEKKEFRNLYYFRLRKDSLLTEILAIVFKKIYSELSTLYIDISTCGSGLYIQHGTSTIISAKSMGKNCIINQQVTIGYQGKNKFPHIGDNVRITSGAKVFGDVFIGNNVKVGANAVVVKNVPDDCVVVGIPAYIVKRNGIKVREPL